MVSLTPRLMRANQDAEFHFRPNPLTGRLTKQYDPKNKRRSVVGWMALFSVVNILLMTAIATPFVQWSVQLYM